MSASLLPNGKQQFIDISGKPLVAGLVYMYVPSTLIFKNTWQDSSQSSLNANPIVLDSRGQAVIYGAGSYRQIVKDNLGNLIWDEETVGFGLGGNPVTTLTHSNSPYTMTSSDSALFCDVSGGAITINLLSAPAYAGYLTIKIKGAATNAVTIIPNGTDTIDGFSSYTLSLNNQAITLLSNLVSFWGII